MSTSSSSTATEAVLKPVATSFKLNPKAAVFVPAASVQQVKVPSGLEIITNDLQRFSFTDHNYQHNQVPVDTMMSYGHIQRDPRYFCAVPMGYGAPYGNGVGHAQGCYHQPQQFSSSRRYGFGMGLR